MANEARFAGQMLSKPKRHVGSKDIVDANTSWRNSSPLYRDKQTALQTVMGPFQLSACREGWRVWDEFNDCGLTVEGNIFDAFRIMLDRYQQWYEDNGVAAVGESRVYFIGTELQIGKYVKIGVSIDPSRRLKALQTASPERLRILATKPGDTGTEAYYHNKHHSCRCEGEWFKINRELMRDICAADRVK